MISNFNSKFFSLDKLKTQSLMLDINYQLVIVKKFDKMQSAMSYLEGIKSLKSVRDYLGVSEYEYFIISSNNFKSFYKDKSLDKYLVYFEDKYFN